MNMPGVEFLVDELSRKKAVLINREGHGELWQDLFDDDITHTRSTKPRESLAQVTRLLAAPAKLKRRG